jgi:hypothetical protein
MHRHLLLALVMLLPSCLMASKSARNDTLMPAVALAWGNPEAGVQSDTLRGIHDAIDDRDLNDAAILLGWTAQITMALELGDRPALQMIPWNQLAPYAARGIDDRVQDGQMVEQAAVFLRRRLDNFNAAYIALIDPNYVWTDPVQVYSTRTEPATLPSPYGRVPVYAAHRQ